MTDDQPTRLDAFIEAAGAELASAQNSIAGAELRSSTLAVAEASLEAKVALESGEDGGVQLVPIGAKRLADPGVKVGSVSTLTLNFVALADESVPTARTPPRVSRDQAIAELSDRDDVKRMAGILGNLTFDASLVPERSGWLVSARDQSGRVVREVVVDGGES